MALNHGKAGAAGARSKELAQLLGIREAQTADRSLSGRLKVIAKLKVARRVEIARGRSGSWLYDVNRHLNLCAALRSNTNPSPHISPKARIMPPEQNRNAPVPVFSYSGCPAVCKNYPLDTHEGMMRTNIEIDPELIAKAMSLPGLTTKRETEALRLLVRLKSQEAIRDYRGKLAWDGDLEEMRLDSDSTACFAARALRRARP